MKKLALIVFAFALTGFGGESLSTERKVHGVITSIDSAQITIATQQRAVTGKVDPARTKVTIHGRAAKASDLKLTSLAKAELCLDDVWLAIDAR
jgi:hypothetical protein